MKIYIMLLILLFLSVISFAATDPTPRCQQTCCGDFNGTYSYGQCTGGNQVSYNSCVSTCVQTAKSLSGCCGSSFILVLIPGLVIYHKQKSS